MSLSWTRGNICVVCLVLNVEFKRIYFFRKLFLFEKKELKNYDLK